MTKNLKHVQLFEAFQNSGKLDMFLKSFMNDPEMAEYELSLDDSDPETPLLVWNNPQDSEKWRQSGYAEDYSGDFSSVSPMNVLAFMSMGNDLYAYKLTPEEKYYGEVVMLDENPDPDQMVEINSPVDIKRAFEESLWEMD